jgi:UDP-glucose 4-epimerase
MAGRRILLTGGAGYIGSHTYLALVAAGHEVTILDNFGNARRSVVDRLGRITGLPVEVVDADVRDAAALDTAFAKGRFEAVVHFAALKAVSESVQRPLDYFDVNVGGLTTLLKRHGGAQLPEARLLLLGHGLWRARRDADARNGRIQGDEPLWPDQDHRRADARLAVRLRPAMGHRHPALLQSRGRTWLGDDRRGPAGHPQQPDALHLQGGDGRVAQGVGLRERLRHARRDGRARLHPCGGPRARACPVAGKLFESGEGHLVNLGTGRGYSVLEVIAAYKRASNRDLAYEIAPRRAGDVPIYVARAEKAAEVLGFRTEKTLDEMCASSWAWISGPHSEGTD